LSKFFVSGDRIRVEVVKAFLEALPRIREFVSKGLWTLYASSVLFVYEGDEKGETESPRACMIDFAHSWKHEGDKIGEIDSGYLVGLDNIVRYFRAICEDGPK